MTDYYSKGIGLTDRHRICKRALLGAALLLTALSLMLPRTSAAGGFPGIWSYTNGPLNTARSNHTATLLPNGNVLVAGGLGSGTYYLNSAELYNPGKSTFELTGAMASARMYHTATLLPNGKVLVAGGMYLYGLLATAELYDPATGSWSPTGSLSQSRIRHTATLLKNGKVLVAGGMYYVAGHYWGTTSAELYDPVTGAWSSIGSLNIARGDHSATLLKNGKVLVAGGRDASTIMTWEIYDPDSDHWSTPDYLYRARSYHAAALLTNGKVLVAGGYVGEYRTNPAEIYNPQTGSWKLTGYLKSERADHTAILLPNGKVLVAAGEGFSTASSEIYDPADETWGSAANLGTARIEHTVTLLNNGQVLVIGGLGTGYEPISSAEIYPKKLGSPLPKPPTKSWINLLLLD